MHERLRSLMSGITTSEQMGLIIRGVAHIEERGFVDFQDSLEQDIVGMSEQPGEITQYIITQRLLPFYSDMLQSMGVELVEDTDLSTYIDFAEWLYRVENFDDPSAIHNVASSDNEDEEILADVLAIVSAKDAEEIFPYIEDVSSFLIEKISDLTSVEVIEDRRQSEAYRRSLGRVRAVLKYSAERPQYGSLQMDIVDLLKIGRSPETMISVIGPMLSVLSREGKALVVASIFAASDVDDTELTRKAGDYIQSITQDPAVAITIVKMTTQLLEEAVRG